MSKQIMEDFIGEVLTGDAQKNALEFAIYLRANDMLFKKGKNYWEDKLYWAIKFKDEIVCYILIGYEENPGEKSDSWIVWCDDSNSDWFNGDFPLDEHIKKFAWKNVEICGKCGSCTEYGKDKTIFEKEFDNVCGTNMRFEIPNAEEVESMKKIFEIRKNYIHKNI